MSQSTLSQQQISNLKSRLELNEREIARLLNESAAMKRQLQQAGAGSSPATFLIEGEGAAEARIRLLNMLGASVNPAILHNDLAVVCFRSGELAEAVKHLRIAVAVDETFLPAKRNLADIFAQNGERETATRIHEEILSRNPDDIESLVALGALRLQDQRYESAEYCARRALQISPSDFDAQHLLDLVLQETRRTAPTVAPKTSQTQTTRLSEEDYQAQLRAEINTYKEQVVVHDLPEINHVVNNAMISPMLKELVGETDSMNWWANEIRELAGSLNREVRALSIGCGNGDVEIDLVKRAGNPQNLYLLGVDINPHMVERGNAEARKSGLMNVEFATGDFNALMLEGKFDIILANHALHHVVELERLFEAIDQHATDEMIFLVNDMIGQNGHVMWKNTERVMGAIWDSLDEKYKLNWHTRQYDREPMNHDFSNEGFEGIRAQDILPLLVKTFDVDMFLPFYGFVNRLLERGYGHNYDVNDAEDLALANKFMELDLKLLTEKKLSPAQAFMRLRKKGHGQELQFRLQTPTEALATRGYPIAEEDYFTECFGTTNHVTADREELFEEVFG